MEDISEGSAQPTTVDLGNLAPEPRPELVFGLVGPIGVNLDLVIKALSDGLKVANYQTKEIRVSRLIENICNVNCVGMSEHQRIASLMDEGNRLRSVTQNADAAAVLAIFEIMRLRFDRDPASKESDTGTAYILRSLKHPSEVQRLRTLYGKGFTLISVYAPREERVTALSTRIGRMHEVPPETISARALSENLVDRDESEEGNAFGQDVQGTFPLADLFVDARNPARLRDAIKRFLHLTFGQRFLTPSKDEHGMYHAKSAALRSADLNRQVGAAILRPTGELIAVGCNDVPKFGGDQYWEGDDNDARDFRLGQDSSAAQREVMLVELLKRLDKAKILKDDKLTSGVESLAKDLLHGKDKPLKGAGFVNLLEFGRSVHAEMAALMTSARLGLAVKGATLYSTTFPCHMCARHIVASGIERVVYIEPYPKSRARELHNDSIAVDPIFKVENHVSFEPFQGISPRQYQSIFSADDLRKTSTGHAAEWSMATGKLRWQRFVSSYKQIEKQLVMLIPNFESMLKADQAKKDQEKADQAKKDQEKQQATTAAPATPQG